MSLVRLYASDLLRIWKPPRGDESLVGERSKHDCAEQGVTVFIIVNRHLFCVYSLLFFKFIDFSLRIKLNYDALYWAEHRGNSEMINFLKSSPQKVCNLVNILFNAYLCNFRI